MIVISYGIEKSGSTLAFEIAKAVLELNGHPQQRLPSTLVNAGPAINITGGWTDERLSQLIEFTAGTRIVVRTHHPPFHLSTDRVIDYVRSGDLKIHVVYRDPRDTVLSVLDWGTRARALNHRGYSDVRTIGDAIAKISGQIGHLRHWGSLPSLKLLYDDFAFDRTTGPQLIGDDLGVAVDPDAVWDLVNERSTMKNVARPCRYKTDLWPDEAARIERAFPLFFELVRGNPCAGWFVPSP